MKAFVYPVRDPNWPKSSKDNAIQLVEDDGSADGGRVLCIFPITTSKEAIAECAKVFGVDAVDFSDYPT